jgi:hypothetical protein
VDFLGGEMVGQRDEDGDVIHFGDVGAAGEFEVCVDLSAGEGEGRGRPVRDEGFAQVFRQDAIGARGGGDPARQRGVDDAVGDALRGEVVVVGAGLRGGTIERKIAVVLAIDNRGGAKKSAGLAWIDTDAARECDVVRAN